MGDEDSSPCAALVNCPTQCVGQASLEGPAQCVGQASLEGPAQCVGQPSLEGWATLPAGPVILSPPVTAILNSGTQDQK